MPDPEESDLSLLASAIAVPAARHDVSAQTRMRDPNLARSGPDVGNEPQCDAARW